MGNTQSSKILFYFHNLLLIGLVGCSKPVQIPPAAEREVTQSPVVSESSAKIVALVKEGKLPLRGNARVGVLYHIDQPAHREAVLKWFKDYGAKVLFENETFGYMDAEIDWGALSKLIETRGDLGLDETSMLKLEIDEVTTLPEGEKREKKEQSAPQSTSFIGPVHSAGYGAKVKEFREKAAADLGVSVEDIAGQGISVAIFDGGIDLSRTDVYGNRMVDYVIGDETLWLKNGKTIWELEKEESSAGTDKGLEAIKGDTSLRIFPLKEETLEYDANGSGSAKDTIYIATYFNKHGKPEVRVRPAHGLAFGDPILDLAEARKKGQPQLINFHTGKYYKRDEKTPPPPSAAGVKLRVVEDKIEVAVIGFGNNSSAAHGTANLHMVGGSLAVGDGGQKYEGVAPQVNFLGTQAWKMNSQNYGDSWIPLARTIVQSAAQGADILDLDIFTPGPRNGTGLISTLLCRITTRTHIVPVVAAHNYAPSPNTIQSLAQSPCVIGVGASHSKARLQLGDTGSGLTLGTIDPSLQQDDSVETTFYSGRGFALNGQFKPDIIAPAYAYVASNGNMTRFGGTSGATPTTAGMIALLKQAAKRKNIELNLEQIKFLLQGSSLDAGSKSIRDGYGFADLHAAWELFKKYSDLTSGKTQITPLRLEGNPSLHFDGKPTQSVIPVPLRRPYLKGAETGAVPMRFSVTYAGASSDGDVKWLKLMNEKETAITETLEMDGPMQNESAGLRLYIDLNEEQWESLPPGDHIAVVRGVRKVFAEGGDRLTDFLMPISFTKAEEVKDSRYELQPLYADKFQTFAFATEPGDVLFLTGNARCDGKKFPEGSDTNREESLFVVIDNEPFYTHAQDLVNPYVPIEVGPTPIRIEAKKSLVRISVFRRTPLRCDGPVTGTLGLRRFSLKHRQTSTRMIEDGGNLLATVYSEIKVDGTGNQLTELREVKGVGNRWEIQWKPSELIVRRKISGAFAFVAPTELGHVRAVPTNKQVFQAILSQHGADGKFVDEATSPARFATGLGSLATEFQGGYVGLQLSNVPAGHQISFLPTHPGADAVLEVRVKAPVGYSARMQPIALPREYVIDGVEFSSDFTFGIPKKAPTIYGDYQANDTYELIIPFSLMELRNSVGGIDYLPLEAGRGQLNVPLPLKAE